MKNFDIDHDIVRRNVKRELPCKLTDEELLRVARQRATKEAERAQLEADLAKEKKRRSDQITELADEIGKMGRELHTGEQERTVPCNDVFRRGDDGTGWIHTIRMDTFDEVERKPATAHETQRYLPAVDGPVHVPSVLDTARAKQRSAQDETSDVPAAEGEGETDGADADLGEGDLEDKLDRALDDAEAAEESDADAEQPAKKRGGRKGK